MYCRWNQFGSLAKPSEAYQLLRPKALWGNRFEINRCCGGQSTFHLSVTTCILYETFLSIYLVYFRIFFNRELVFTASKDYMKLIRDGTLQRVAVGWNTVKVVEPFKGVNPIFCIFDLSQCHFLRLRY